MTFLIIVFMLGCIHDAMTYISKFTGLQLEFLGYRFSWMMFLYTAAALYLGSALIMVFRFIGLTNQVRDMNMNLENKVIDRTRELQKARDALWVEMELAKKIQTMLLPKKPSIAGYAISAYMKPAEEIGGDYYDIIHAGGRDWMAIGDVSGRGVPAGLIMMMAQTAIHTAVIQNPDLAPSRLLGVINGVITENIRNLGVEKKMSMTVFAVHEKGCFHFSGLHQDIIVHRAATGVLELIQTSGSWLGLKDDIEDSMEDGKFSLESGDVMLIYTDGIIEAWRKDPERDERGRGTELFGLRNLKSTFQKLSNREPEDIIKGILWRLGDFHSDDDITLLAVRRE
jgi:histidine kinase